MKFSQRIKKTPIIKDLQLESIDLELKNGLWNIVKLLFLDKIFTNEFGNTVNIVSFLHTLWHNFYKLPIDTIPESQYSSIEYIRDKFYKNEWYYIYDFIEFLSGIGINNIDETQFMEAINIVLEREFSAYRFVDGIIAPISNETEIKEIEEAINQNVNFTSLNGTNIHLTSALEKLSNRENRDYRNSIKESISAIETTCRILTKEKTLGKALNSFESSGIKINSQLKSGFEKLYAYTNSSEGIRHAIIKDHKMPDFDDAKYFLVVCSAFINYLVGKCKTSGIEIQ